MQDKFFLFQAEPESSRLCGTEIHNSLSYILNLQTLNSKRVCVTKIGIFLRICLGLWS
jgi:hypothetical protein